MNTHTKTWDTVRAAGSYLPETWKVRQEDGVQDQSEIYIEGQSILKQDQ